MTAPTAPYCTSQQVRYLLRQIVPGESVPSDFDNTSTIPSKTEVEYIIADVAAQIEMAFSLVGYKVPFAIWQSEGWPAHQTTFLRMLNAMGAAAYLLVAQKPAPALGQGRGNQDKSVGYLEAFEDKLKMIQDSAGARFRADCYYNTPAWRGIHIPRGPMTSWGEDIIDAIDFSTWSEGTRILSRAYNDMRLWAGGEINLYSLGVYEAFA